MLRLISYASNRSLWLDEAMLALNIERRSFGELLGTLDFNQAAPLGFLWLEKSAVGLLGVNELALRLWPLVAGAAVLIVFNAVGGRLLRPGARAYTLLLLAVSGSLVYFSTEVKQYSFDVAVAALLLLVAVREDPTARWSEGEPQPQTDPRGVRSTASWLFIGLVGTLGVWFSHPLVFLLPGLLVYVWTAEGDRSSRTRPIALIAVAWAASFGAAFWLTARGASQNPAMAELWREGFMPLVPRSWEEIRWYPEAVAGWIRTLVDFSPTVSPARTAGIWGGAILVAVGSARAWRGDRRALCLVGLPIILALAASAVRFYPFRGRLLLFLVPSTAILVGWGIEAVRGDREEGAKARALRAVTVVPAIALVAAASVALVAWLRAPGREELRPVLERVAARVQPGDVVYLHSGAQHAALFYERVCEPCRLDPAVVVRGAFLSGSEEAMETEVARLPAAGRLWTVFSHEWWGWGDLERDRLVARLSERSGPPDTVTAPGAEAYLFTQPVDATERGPQDPRVDLLAAAGRAGRLQTVAGLSTALAADAWAAGRVEEAHWFALRPAYAVLYGLRDAPRALTLAEQGLARFPPDPESLESGLVLADFFVRAGQTDRARALVGAWLQTVTVERPHGPLARMEALLALATGDPGGAISGLTSAASRSDGCDLCADFDLAVAYEVIGAADSALAAYERVVTGAEGSARSPAPHAVPYAFRRLGAIYSERRGAEGAAIETDEARAIDFYERLLDLWAGADPDFEAERLRAETVLARIRARAR